MLLSRRDSRFFVKAGWPKRLLTKDESIIDASLWLVRKDSRRAEIIFAEILALLKETRLAELSTCAVTDLTTASFCAVVWLLLER